MWETLVYIKFWDQADRKSFEMAALNFGGRLEASNQNEIKIRFRRNADNFIRKLIESGETFDYEVIP